MISIWKEFEFSAAHYLPKVATDHPCARMHGHNYKVRVHFSSDAPSEQGFVVDFRALNTIKAWLDEKFDHQVLNDSLKNPTSEILAGYIMMNAPRPDPASAGENLHMDTVEVQETEKTGAIWMEPCLSLIHI